MKKIIYKGTIEESDYNRVKDIDSENYITPDGKTVLPKLTRMPLRDLAILSFTDENELKKYYTGNEEYFSYSVVELMLDTRIQTRNLSRHKISSFEDALYLLLYLFRGDTTSGRSRIHVRSYCSRHIECRRG